MKVCTKCGVSKAESEYFLRDAKVGRLHAQCKICYKKHRQSYYNSHYRTYQKEYLQRAKIRREKIRQEFRANMLDYLSTKECENCGEKDMRVFEFDHIDPSTKSFSISQAVRLGHGWSETLVEIQKCKILCANCHKKRTSDQFGWYKSKKFGGTDRI